MTRHWLFVGLFIVVLFLCALISIEKCVEGFEFTSIVINPNIRRPKLLMIEGVELKNVNLTDKFDIQGSSEVFRDPNSYILTDTFNCWSYHSLKNKYFYTEAFDDYRVMLVFSNLTENSGKMIDLRNLLNTFSSSTIEVFVRNKSEYDLANVLFECTSHKSVKFRVQISPDNFMKAYGVHICLANMSDNVFIKLRTVPNMSVVSYDHLDIDKTRYLLPFHEQKYVDVSSLYNSLAMDGGRILCIAFRICLWSPKDLSYSPSFAYSNTETFEFAGFYAQHFKVCKFILEQASQLYEPISQRQVNQPIVQVIENRGGRISLTSTGSPPKGQPWVRTRNGIYENSYKMKFSKIIETIAINDTNIVVKVIGLPVQYKLVYFEDIDKLGDVIRNSDNIAHIVIWLNNDEERDRKFNMTKYECTTNSKLEFDFLCEKDSNGGGVWDRPCETDFDCPFFDVSRNRGGCQSDGRCEMPLGIERTGFRKYDSQTSVWKNKDGENAFALDDLQKNLIGSQDGSIHSPRGIREIKEKRVY